MTQQVQCVRCASAAILGVRSHPVEVEVSRAPGLPGVTMVGLARGAVREALTRIRAAIASVRGVEDKNTARLVINLLPAELPKSESALDLAVALAVLAVEGKLNGALDGYRFFGELSLSGRLEPVKGAALVAELARAEGDRALFVPSANADEACIIPGVTVLPATSLHEVIAHLEGSALIEPHVSRPLSKSIASHSCLSEVQGHVRAKRALEIAAAGGHNMLMIGPPGSGKTMLARRLSGLLPPLSLDERIDVTRVHSAAGLLTARLLLDERPFRSPHHTSSDVALCGGGTNPRPGEISLAHHGVLFLDELPEFSRRALEALREPLEDGCIHVARAAASVAFPARSVLIAAMNPCPCGYFRDVGAVASPGSRACLCSFESIQRYRGRLSGPLLDRIDLHVQVDGVPWRTLTGQPSGETSLVVRQRVMRARALQRRRLGGDATNAVMDHRTLSKLMVLTPDVQHVAERVAESYGLSTRAMTRVLKVARTIADLDASDEVRAAHFLEAVEFRALDGKPRRVAEVA